MKFLDTKSSDLLAPPSLDHIRAPNGHGRSSPTLLTPYSSTCLDPKHAPDGQDRFGLEALLPPCGRRELISYLKKQKFIILSTPQNHVNKGSKDNIIATREINKTPFSPRREGSGMRGEQSTP